MRDPSTSERECDKTLLFDKFEMTDMKELHYFLGIEVIRTPTGIMISQRHYILNLLYKFGYKSVWADSVSATHRESHLPHDHSTWS